MGQPTASLVDCQDADANVDGQSDPFVSNFAYVSPCGSMQTCNRSSSSRFECVIPAISATVTALDGTFDYCIFFL